MKIIVIGAGVLGSLYAARLHDAGHAVTILARGSRLEQIRSSGILLEDAVSGRKSCSRLPAVEVLNPAQPFDLALVLVRSNQLESVLPMLSANPGIPNVLFMVNNAAGPQRLVEALGRGRVLLGFPGAGGERVGDTVRCQVVSANSQPTTLGELDGQLTPRLREIADCLQSAGFPTAFSPNMDAWLKTHVALVSPIANALYLAGGDNYRLANTRDGLVLLVRAVREGLAVLDALGVPVTPGKYRLLKWIPEPVLVAFLRWMMNRPSAELVLARHANAARADEMKTLAEQFQALARQTSLATTAIDLLYTYIPLDSEPLPAGSQRLAVKWEEMRPLVALGVGAAALAAGWWVARKVVRHS